MTPSVEEPTLPTPSVEQSAPTAVRPRWPDEVPNGRRRRRARRARLLRIGIVVVVLGGGGASPWLFKAYQDRYDASGFLQDVARERTATGGAPLPMPARAAALDEGLRACAWLRAQPERERRDDSPATRPPALLERWAATPEAQGPAASGAITAAAWGHLCRGAWRDRVLRQEGD